MCGMSPPTKKKKVRFFSKATFCCDTNLLRTVGLPIVDLLLAGTEGVSMALVAEYDILNRKFLRVRLATLPRPPKNGAWRSHLVSFVVRI